MWVTETPVRWDVDYYYIMGSLISSISVDNSDMTKLLLSLSVLGFIALASAHTNPWEQQPPAPIKVAVPVPVPVPVPVLVPTPVKTPEQGGGLGGGGGGGNVGSGGVGGTCPKPSGETLRCLREWACQYVIRLDLRCLLNLNGNPLLGNLISLPGLTGGGGGGGTGGTGGGILGSLLG